jgi:hypothetical protein
MTPLLSAKASWTARTGIASAALGNGPDGPGVIASEPSAFCLHGGMLLADYEGMLTMLTAPALTLVFLCVVVGLGAAFVWALWEIEQISKPHRKGDRFG